MARPPRLAPGPPGATECGPRRGPPRRPPGHRGADALLCPQAAHHPDPRRPETHRRGARADDRRARRRGRHRLVARPPEGSYRPAWIRPAVLRKGRAEGPERGGRSRPESGMDGSGGPGARGARDARLDMVGRVGLHDYRSRWVRRAEGTCGFGRAGGRLRTRPPRAGRHDGDANVHRAAQENRPVRRRVHGPGSHRRGDPGRAGSSSGRPVHAPRGSGSDQAQGLLHPSEDPAGRA